MAQRFTHDTIHQIRKHKEDGKSNLNIAELLNISTNSVIRYTQKNEQGEYMSTAEINEARANAEGFSNYTSLLEEKARAAGYTSVTERFRERVRKNGYTDIYEYQKHRATERKKQDENIIISILLPQRLKEMDKKPSWLHKTMSLSAMSVSNYISGKTIPKLDHQPRLFETLQLNHGNLADYLHYLESTNWFERLEHERKEQDVIAGEFHNGQRERLEISYLLLK